jgi:hypothetical protein
MTVKDEEAFQSNWLIQEKNILSCTKLRDLAESNNYTEMAVVMNVSLFMSICSYDLSVTLYDLVSLEPGWKKNLQARLASLLIVEFIEDLGSLTGKDFRTSIRTILQNPEDKERFNAIGKNLSRFRKKHDQDLRSIRNVSVAHRG